MQADKAKTLAQTLIDCFGNIEEAHTGYKRAMQNNCSMHQFQKLLAPLPVAESQSDHVGGFCTNCGFQGCLEDRPVPAGQDVPFLEMGEFDGDGYSEEREVTVQKCTKCTHEMIDLS